MIEKAIFRDTYNLLEKYTDAETENEWLSFVREIDKLCKKHNSKLCEGMLTAVLDHVETKYNIKHRGK